MSAESISTFFWNITHRPRLVDALDMLLVAFIIYQLLKLTSGTRASQVLKGFVLLVAASWLSTALRLTAMSWLLTTLLSNGTIVLMILFQPELRRALEHVGRRTRLMRAGQQEQSEGERIKSEITQCLMNLSRRRIGALIVFEKRTGLNDFIDTGVSLDALISGGLLINIFEPNTPLHDGAVIIRESRIVSAACVLPLTEAGNLSRELGTRHRAGIGITETTDALVLIVSEETGTISMAQGGKLTRHLNADDISACLNDLYRGDDLSVQARLKAFFKRVLARAKGENA